MTLPDRNDPPRLDRRPRPARKVAVQKSDILSLSRGAENIQRTVATGLLLLWHDFWDDAHEIAQSNEGNAHHDLLHAILHRREGDFGNAGYWFRSAGNHPCFDSIASRVAAVLAQDPLREKLLPGGKWNPAAFLEAVRRDKTDAGDPVLRAVQAEEIIAFHAWLTR